LVAALSRDLRVTVRSILDEVVRATLLQTLIHDWPAYLIHAIRVLAEDHNYPEQFLQEMAVQMQAVAEEVCGAPQPAD